MCTLGQNRKKTGRVNSLLKFTTRCNNPDIAADHVFMQSYENEIPPLRVGILRVGIDQ